jgi:hypothetical protein
MPNMKKPAPKKPMAPRTPSTGVKKPMPKIIGSKPSVKKPMRAPKYPGQPLAPGTTPNTPIRVQRSKPVTPAKPKAPVKKKVLVMPNKISPSKMTPAQKARYLKNPERYDG